MYGLSFDSSELSVLLILHVHHNFCSVTAAHNENKVFLDLYYAMIPATVFLDVLVMILL